ncbi:hypothetical protein BS50DRAFT_592983 [Corynespora cassiicola Philippines]|uniref:Uncharacterized protein n=1 Tax=Corynespora cassiicola Philippines TaxID=1448308 RepID=A0A2T2N7V7_CORCC|nr:hypothetical protein BS50DRAFT_592983 [Corynespora cassiicola Philippines]
MCKFITHIYEFCNPRCAWEETQRCDNAYPTINESGRRNDVPHKDCSVRRIIPGGMENSIYKHYNLRCPLHEEEGEEDIKIPMKVACSTICAPHKHNVPMGGILDPEGHFKRFEQMSETEGKSSEKPSETGGSDSNIGFGDQDSDASMHSFNMSMQAMEEHTSDLRIQFPYALESFFDDLYELYPREEFNLTFWQRQTWFGEFSINRPTYYITSSLKTFKQPVWMLVFNAGFQVHAAIVPYLSDMEYGTRLGENGTLAKVIRDWHTSFTIHNNQT